MVACPCFAAEFVVPCKSRVEGAVLGDVMVVAEAKACAEGVDGIKVHFAVLLLEIHAVAVLVRVAQLAVVIHAGLVIHGNDLADFS